MPARWEWRALPAMNAKVLIVDDEPAVLKSTALLVQSLGYDAVTLSEASKILATIGRERPSLLLQDLRMPGLNVGGLVAVLRLDPATATLPIILFSADPEAAEVAAQYDAWGVLSKPFTREQLAALLTPVLGPPQAATTLAGVARRTEAIFHDYWNLLAALASYSIILNRSVGLGREAASAVQGLDDLVLALESKTDRLRRLVQDIVSTVQQSPGQGPAPAGVESAT